jgi:DNA-binding NarL/FixJ family response regulator
MEPVRVLIVDDHALVRAGLRALLDKLPDVAVIGEAGDGREALKITTRDLPDIVLMDIAMAGLNGLEATRRIIEKFPGIHVIILSMYSDEEYVWQALRSGAEGYLLKGASLAELELAIKSVARGENYLSPPISRSVVLDYIRRAGGAPSQLEKLTPRQVEILQLVAEGHTTKQIALTLRINIKTVESHRKELMARLGVRDVASLVKLAVKLGLIRLDVVTQ